MQLSENEFRSIVTYIKGNYGIDLSQKRVLITGRLENYLLRNGYQSYKEYIDLVEKDPNGKEAVNLVNVLTTNHTYFMREFEHFEYMEKVILPWIRKHRRTGERMSESGQPPLLPVRSLIRLKWYYVIFLIWIKRGIHRF